VSKLSEIKARRAKRKDLKEAAALRARRIMARLFAAEEGVANAVRRGTSVDVWSLTAPGHDQDCRLTGYDVVSEGVLDQATDILCDWGVIAGDANVGPEGIEWFAVDGEQWVLLGLEMLPEDVQDRDDYLLQPRRGPTRRELEKRAQPEPD
jgi:hypothetical protein